jgi:protoporphyrinogen oxidase
MESYNLSPKIIVLGAGCSGLSVAWRLAQKGISVEVIEAQSRVGGIGGGHFLNGNIFEYGPHVFHSSDPEIMQDIKSLVKDELIPFKRTIKIKFLGEYFDFPLKLSDILSKLPLTTLVSAGISFLFHTIKGNLIKPKVENSETILMRNYGEVLYDLFFKTYIEHVWGIKPAEFSPKFAQQRIPKLDILEVLEKLHQKFKINKRKKIDTHHYAEKVEGELFTTSKGFSGITDKIAEEIVRLGGKIILNACVKQIFWDQNGVNGISYKLGDESYIKEASAIISTIPVNLMVNMLQPVPEDNMVIESSENIRFKALVFVGIVVDRRKVLPSSFMYFRELSFNRITDLEYFGLDIKPNGSTILVAEISCDEGDEYWRNEQLSKDMVIRDLVNERLIEKKEIIECHVYRLAQAYPIYRLGFEESLARIMTFVDQMGNFKSIGRQGAFQYINAHLAIKEGYNTADEMASIVLSNNG